MLQNELKEIRTQLRLAMNGVISTSMREKGIVYKLNFGVPLPEIKQIAATHKPDSELAAALWKEDIREFKILASFLQPVDEFSSQEAKQWVKEIPYLERVVGGVVHKADIFSRPVSFSTVILATDNPEEALATSLNKYGSVDLDYMSEISGMTDDA